MSTRLEENTKKLEENSEELKSVGDQVAVLTVKVDGEIIPTLENHSRLLKKIALSTEKNVENIFRLDKRVSVVEANAGIQPPSELHIIR